MNEEHKKLTDAIKFLISDFERENRLVVLSVELRRGSIDSKNAILAVHMPVVPRE